MSAELHKLQISHFIFVAGNCTNGQLRLVGGSSPLEGRVEICIGGVWGTVTDENWGGPEAKVACRQLGYIDGCTINSILIALATKITNISTFTDGIPYGSAFFGSGSGPIQLDNVVCKGNEQALINCTHTPPDGDDAHNQDAGVKCFNQTSMNIVNIIIM